MIKIWFEYKITFAYLLIGGIWIIFSDILIGSMIHDIKLLTEIQTYKGWFYVIVTSIIFFLYIKNHLSKLRDTEDELEKHKNNLILLVKEKTKELEKLNEELKSANDELHNKNKIIVEQNNELKHTLIKLKETQAHLMQSEKMASLGILTAGVAHEINNPLNYIMGAYVGLVNYFKQYGSENNQKIDVFLKSINIGLERATRIVKGLNQFSRNNVIMDESCNIHSILANCISMLQNKMKHTITLKKKYTTNFVMVKGNVGMLHQVFINVLSNAIYAIDGQGVITIETNVNEGNVEIVINDTGCGIEKEKLSQITDPFYTTKPAGEGTGLGLYITYSIIKEHKGSIIFDSVLTKGTTITIVLPIQN